MATKRRGQGQKKIGTCGMAGPRSETVDWASTVISEPIGGGWELKMERCTIVHPVKLLQGRLEEEVRARTGVENQERRSSCTAGYLIL